MHKTWETHFVAGFVLRPKEPSHVPSVTVCSSQLTDPHAGLDAALGLCWHPILGAGWAARPAQGEFHPRAGLSESAMTRARLTARLSSRPHKMRRQRCQEPSLTAPFRRGCCEELSRSESAVLPGLAFQAGRGTIPTTPPAKTTLGIPWEPGLARASWYFLLPRPDPAGC